jgi:tetratricopeptide (TPR) repeat protein
MRKWGKILSILLAIAAALAVAGGVAWPWLRWWLSDAAYAEAWIDYLVVDLDIGRWGPVVTLILVAAIELVWALILGRRSGAFERQLKRVDRLHAREVEVLTHEVALLKEEREALLTELKLRADLIREEKARLWAQFENVQQESGLALGKPLVLDPPHLSPDLRGEWRQCISHLERIEMIDSVTARKRRSAIQLQQDAEELLRLGNACYYLGEYERAIAQYDRTIELAPNESEAFVNRAVVNYVLARYEVALMDLESALRLGERPWAYLYRGLVRERMGENRRALEDYARAIRQDASFKEGYYRRGLLHALLGEYDKAFQDQDKVLELDQDDPSAYTARGVARAGLGDSQWALADLDRGCLLAPQRYEGFYHRGRVRHILGMHEEALQDLGRVIELSPTFVPAYLLRGDSNRALGENRRALADYGKAIERQPKNAAAYHARGKVRAAIKEFERAIEDFTRALEIDPGLAVVLADRGAAYEKLGEYEQAIQDLDRAIALDSNLAIAYYSRGLVHGNRGEYDRASRDLNRAVALDPSLKNLEQAVQNAGSE